LKEFIQLELRLQRGTRRRWNDCLTAEVSFPAEKINDQEFLREMVIDVLQSLEKQYQLQKRLRSRGLLVTGGLTDQEAEGNYLTPKQAHARRQLRKKKRRNAGKSAESALFMQDGEAR